MMGFTLGNPILKNKLFNFASLEYWKVSYPNAYVNTVPTALEQAGDFSQSYNIDGGNSDDLRSCHHQVRSGHGRGNCPAVSRKQNTGKSFRPALRGI